MEKIDRIAHAETFTKECQQRIAALMDADADRQAIFLRMTGAERVVCTVHMCTMRMLDTTVDRFKSWNDSGDERVDSTHADARVYNVLSFLFGDDKPLADTAPKLDCAIKNAFFSASKPGDTDIECTYYQYERPDLINTWPFIRLRNRTLGRIIILDAAEICFRSIFKRDESKDVSHLYYGYDNLGRDGLVVHTTLVPINNEYIYKRTATTRRIMANVFDVIWRVFDTDHRLLTALCLSAFHANMFCKSDSFRAVTLQCEKNSWTLHWDDPNDDGKGIMAISTDHDRSKSEIHIFAYAAFDINASYKRFDISEDEAQAFVTLYLRFASERFRNYNIRISRDDAQKTGRPMLTTIKRKNACIRRAIEKQQ